MDVVGTHNLHMPELPEVEVTRRSFATRIEGATVTSLQMGKPLRWPLGINADALVGWRVGAALRRGKYLWLPLAAPANAVERLPSGAVLQQGGLLIHLGMSGSLAFRWQPGEAGPHDHFELGTDRGVLRLTDPRRFGAVVWGEAMDMGLPGKLLAGLGREPFDEALTPDGFHAGLRGRQLAIKQVLLSGNVVVGAGNIYACEALFRARIDPRLAAGKLSRPRAARLLAEVRAVLQEAVDAGGSSLRDFRDTHGAQGHFQLATLVYGREGEDCRACGLPLRRIVQAQRSTFFCGHCQKR
jgi:formamidopyrimidine-DNA glycosylase